MLWLIWKSFLLKQTITNCIIDIMIIGKNSNNVLLKEGKK